jgi:hypothetical protein
LPDARRAARAGAVAAAVWQALDPVLKRTFGTPYSDAELASAFVTRGRLQPLVGLLLHSSTGAAFGLAFARLGGRGRRQAVLAALAENALLWPAMAIVDRVHPNRRDGTWPPLLANPRVFAQSCAGHAAFGLALGTLYR